MSTSENWGDVAIDSHHGCTKTKGLSNNADVEEYLQELIHNEHPY